MKKFAAVFLMAGLLAPFAASPARADGYNFSYHQGRGHDNHHWDRRDNRHWSNGWHNYGRPVYYGSAWRYEPYYPAPVYPVYPRVVVREIIPAPQYYYYAPRY